MSEFESLERCVAYVATRDAMEAARDAVYGWPDDLVESARLAATGAMQQTVNAIQFAANTAGRRRCLREAIAAELDLAATMDVARAMQLNDAGALRMTGRAIAMLGMFLHANGMPELDDELIEDSTQRSAYRSK